MVGCIAYNEQMIIRLYIKKHFLVDHFGIHLPDRSQYGSKRRPTIAQRKGVE